MLDYKQQIVDQANIKGNSKRKFFDYKEQDLVLMLNTQGTKGKMEPYTLPEGPWRITQTHTNGTVSIMRYKYI